MRTVHTSLGFPIVKLSPGERRTIEAQFSWTVFRPDGLVVIGQMDEIRGHFKIAHTRLPLLNRDNVIAYSDIRSKRTTVEYREHVTGNFVRSYRPENVKYNHIDALDYIRLYKVAFLGEESQLGVPHVPASFFSAFSRRNRVVMNHGSKGMGIEVANISDVSVTLYATVFGFAISK